MKRVCQTDSLQPPKVGHFCEPPPLVCLHNSSNSPWVLEQNFENHLEGGSFYILNTPPDQFPVSIATWIYMHAVGCLHAWIYMYVVRPFHTPHPVFYQGLFGLGIHVRPRLCLGDSIVCLKNLPGQVKIF